MGQYSTHNINKVYLMLGAECNFRCRYCLQSRMDIGAQFPMDDIKAQEPTEEVYQYLERLIKIRPSYEKPLVITFWGGEPLLHTEVMKKVIARLGNKPKYGMVTNGALLTPELVDYFNEHKVQVVLSNDGENTVMTRGINVLDDPAYCKMFCRLNDRAVEAVTSAYNYDYKRLFEYINGKVPDTMIGVDALKLTWDMPKDIYNIPLKEYEEKLRWLAGQALVDMIALKKSQATMFFGQHVNKLLSGKTYAAAAKCGCPHFNLNIDCNGYHHVCHNTGEKIGHISEDRIVLVERMDKWLAEHTNKKCKTCEVYPICYGGCPLEVEYKEKTCAINRVFYKVCMDLANAFINNYETISWE